MGSLFMFMLAEATLRTDGTVPRTRAAHTPMGPGGPTYPLLLPTSTREGALNLYIPVCSIHAAHWTTTRYAGHTRGCGAAEATQEACRSGERCGVPSVAAIGPFGGRGVPSGRWALTLSHSLDNRLETTDEVLEGRADKEGDVERLGVVRSAGSLGGGSATAVGPPTRGTAMLRWSYRLCAAADQWGCYAGKFTWYSNSKKITRKRKINPENHKVNLRKNKTEQGLTEKNPGEGAVSGKAGVVPRRLEKRHYPPPGGKKETSKQAITSLIARRPDAHTHRLLPRRHATLARSPLLPGPRAGAPAERLDVHAARCTQRLCRGFCDHSGVPKKFCCCCCCHSCSCEAAVRRRERLCTDARALHARRDAQCARSRARTAPDRLMLSAAHTHTTHTSCCTWWCTAAAWAGRALPGWRGMHTAPSSRWGTSVPAHARPAAHLSLIHISEPTRPY